MCLWVLGATALTRGRGNPPMPLWSLFALRESPYVAQANLKLIIFQTQSLNSGITDNLPRLAHSILTEDYLKSASLFLPQPLLVGNVALCSHGAPTQM